MVVLVDLHVQILDLLCVKVDEVLHHRNRGLNFRVTSSQECWVRFFYLFDHFIYLLL